MNYAWNGRASVTPLSISNAASGQSICATLRSILASNISQAISIIRFSLPEPPVTTPFLRRVYGAEAFESLLKKGSYLSGLISINIFIAKRLLREVVKDKTVGNTEGADMDFVPLV